MQDTSAVDVLNARGRELDLVGPCISCYEPDKRVAIQGSGGLRRCPFCHARTVRRGTDEFSLASSPHPLNLSSNRLCRVRFLLMAQLSNTLIEGWKPDAAIDRWATGNGFGAPISMTDLNLRDLSRSNSGRPAGLYVWEGSNHEIYVGISTASVVGRLRDHCRNYGIANIQSFRFRPADSDTNELREVERNLVHDAITRGFIVFNREYAASIYGDSVLDDRISQSEQALWLEDPVGVNRAQPRTLHTMTSTEQSQSAAKYQAFENLSVAGSVVDAVSVYLCACVPFPFATQGDYWVASCLPSTRHAGGYRRISTLSMGYLEMLWFVQGPGGEVRVYLGTDYGLLPPRGTTRKLASLGAVVTAITHRNGGPKEAVLEFGSVGRFVAAMESSPAIRGAAARFALDRMRMGKVGRYREGHNFVLADQALRRLDHWTFRAESKASPRRLAELMSAWSGR